MPTRPRTVLPLMVDDVMFVDSSLARVEGEPAARLAHAVPGDRLLGEGG